VVAVELVQLDQEHQHLNMVELAELDNLLI
jgi:hypothetical protein